MKFRVRLLQRGAGVFRASFLLLFNIFISLVMFLGAIET